MADHYTCRQNLYSKWRITIYVAKTYIVNDRSLYMLIKSVEEALQLVANQFAKGTGLIHPI